ncbi:5-amino-6-(5-phosphoribosylamino)uracil reductase [Treponema phagedenis]|uniref:dihydrofolate reductase family protein n=1 Tax=Treponema phagedenis TaxID=162 RepID=UPI000B43D7C0|nr:5-amino-6-(5-phosphoribosylamino)uracil reductase [Treponema phagedenis]
MSIDPKGELAFETNTFYYGGVPTHFIEVLTEKASNAYKAFLRSKEISYIVAGQNNIDFEIMFEKLQELFGIRRLMVGGGGTINWTFLDRGFVDEVSMVIAPIANGDPNASRFFTAKEPYTKIKDKAFELKNVEVLDGGVIWALYKTKK